MSNKSTNFYIKKYFCKYRDIINKWCKVQVSGIIIFLFITIYMIIFRSFPLRIKKLHRKSNNVKKFKNNKIQHSIKTCE